MQIKKMINFKISAPSRIVLSGEHSATYGRNFVMAGLNLRTNLEFSELPNSERIIKIDFSRVDLQYDIPFESVESYFFNTSVLQIRSNPIEFLKYIKYYIDINRIWKTRQQRFSLQFFLYLFSTINIPERRPFRLSVSAEISSDRGLGSSTSFAVCLAACFLHWRRLQSGNRSVEFDDQELEEIRRYAESCEDIMQEDVFALMDAQVCVNGKITICRRANYRDYFTKTINSRVGIRLLLISAYVPQNKGQRAQQVVDLRYRNPTVFISFLNKLHEIATKIWDELNFIGDNSEDLNSCQDSLRRLEIDIMKNQKILKDNILSFPRVNQVCFTANRFGFNGKLTGFSGGYVYILLSPKLTDEEIIYLKGQFVKQRFVCILSKFDYDGVKIDE